jgi:hypothetical protein
MSGQWPPEWGEADWDDQEPDEAMTDSGDAYQGNPEFAAVTAALAAMPMPAMPDSVEARITTALAVEAAARAVETTSAGPSAHVLDTSRPRPVPPRRRRQFRLRPAATVAPVIAAMVIGGFVYLVSHSGGTSSSSLAESQPSAAASASAAAPFFSGAGGNRALNEPVPGTHRLAEGENPPFFVAAGGTSYKSDTLQQQVRRAFAALHTYSSGTGAPMPSATGSSTAIPSAQASSAPAATSAAPTSVVGSSLDASAAGKTASSGSQVFAPTPALIGCVLKVTGNVSPLLVEYATYQGKPAYVIFTADRAWIVGVGCTASNPKIRATVSLTG